LTWQRSFWSLLTLNNANLSMSLMLVIYCFTSRSRIFHLYDHHCRWRAAKFRPMLGAQGLWAGRDLYRATPIQRASARMYIMQLSFIYVYHILLECCDFTPIRNTLINNIQSMHGLFANASYHIILRYLKECDLYQKLWILYTLTVYIHVYYESPNFRELTRNLSRYNAWLSRINTKLSRINAKLSRINAKPWHVFRDIFVIFNFIIVIWF
jgi:hypothetical protein